MHVLVRHQLVILKRNVTDQSYINFLRPVVPFMRQNIPRGIFQQDNARPQISRSTMHF